MLTQPTQERKPDIEVLEIHLTNLGAVKAWVRLRVGGLVINNAKIVQAQGHRAYVKLPDQQHPQTGRWYGTVVCVSKPLREEINRAVLLGWAAKLAGGAE